MGGNHVELGEFLRSRRRALSPRGAGVAEGRRRRTPGLRREEVAELAAISPAWYVRLEQGRPVRASRQVLDSLARVLSLDEVEREHLFHLARGERAPVGESADVAVPEYVREFVDYLDPAPALALNRRLDVVGCNGAAASYLGPLLGTNLVRQVCTDASLREVLGPDWARVAGDLVAQLRAAGSSWPGDAVLAALVEELSRSSARFRDWWADHRVRGAGVNRLVLRHPVTGPTEFQHMAFHPADAPQVRLVVLRPVQS